MGRISALLLVVAGVIHLLPLQGVMGASMVARLYGVAVSDPNLEVLLRHRAVMFGLLGVLLLAAAWRVELRGVAFAAGLISAGGFLVVAALVGDYNRLIGRVVIADVVAVICLLLGVAAEWASRRPV
jgi:hypothetical protein